MQVCRRCTLCVKQNKDLSSFSLFVEGLPVFDEVVSFQACVLAAGV